MGKTIRTFGILGICAIVAACGDTSLERAATGALIGGAAAKVTGESVGTGALLGGAAGATCRTVNAC